MIYLKEIEMTKKFRCFRKGNKFTFTEPVTLLVGDQGVGKSSLLNLIDGVNIHKSIKASRTLVINKQKGNGFVFFDSEKMNPRQTALNNSTVGFQVASHFASHGESLLPIIEQLFERQKNTLILIDEPETALSVRSQYLLVELIKKAVKKKNQIILATHSVIFMEEIGTVFNVKTRKYQDTDKYLKWEKKQIKGSIK